MKSIKKYYRVDRREISIIKFTVESYDNLAMVQTIDPKQGIILLYISPGCSDDMDAIMKNLAETIMIAPLESNDMETRL